MKGINYVTDDKDEKTALFIDLAELRDIKTPQTDITALLEGLDGMIAAELSKGQKGRSYDEVCRDILDG